MPIGVVPVDNPSSAFGLGNGSRRHALKKASGDNIGIQYLPAATVTGTATTYGIQVSTRIEDAIAHASLVGIQSEMFLRGSTGNLSGDVRAFQGQITDQNTGTRTISGPVSILDAWHQLAGTHTFTKGVFVINARPAGGGQPWTAFLRAENSGSGGLVVSSDGMTANPESDTEDGFLRVAVDTTLYQIPIYAQ